MSTFYKDGYFWRTHSPDWELEKYGFRPNGCGDLIFNTCAKIIDDNDQSIWAADAIVGCSWLLRHRMRWPDYMNGNDAKNRLQWWRSKLLFKLYIRKTVMYRPQNVMTRDPYIAFYTLIADNPDWINETSIPWPLFNPGVWTWRRYLITGKGLWLYYFLTLNYPKQDYVKRLRRYMDMAVHYKLNT